MNLKPDESIGFPFFVERARITQLNYADQTLYILYLSLSLSLSFFLF